MNLLNRKLANLQLLTEDDVYLRSHVDPKICKGSTYLGFGMIYYAVAHLIGSNLSVCLGSGGGFIPKLMMQAQIDLDLPNAKTIIVDGNMPESTWGEPYWLNKSKHSLNVFYPNIIKIIDTTKNAANLFANMPLIDYLHIDADHSYDGCMQDFLCYSKLLSNKGIITFHDTKPNRTDHCIEIGVPKVIEKIKKNKDWDVIDFNQIACGMAIVKRNTNG